jgi:serine phosphatase RsbU (regulator of sigma subunit)/transcriptional regulator with GAF, ATPase, and Fis domain/anti-sigma regulatory factor (Ser/Thr protein kinase)
MTAPRSLAAHVRRLLGRAGLHEELERARSDAAAAARHAERLQEVTAGLSAAATTEQIADVIINHGIPALAATTGVLGVLETPGELRFVRSTGYGDVFPERLGLDAPWPITAALRNREMIQLRDVEDRRADFSVPERVWDASGKGTLVAVPLLVRDEPMGALGFTREGDEPLTERERTLVETLARQAAQALERARLFEREHEARVQAQVLEQHAAHAAAAVSARDVAEWTLADLRTTGIAIAAMHRLHEYRIELLAAIGIPGSPADQYGSGNVAEEQSASAEAMRTGEAIELQSGSEIEARYPAFASLRRRLGGETLLAIPLRGVGGGIIGALSVASTERGWITDSRRELLAGIAEQAGLALERASLYENDRRARIQAEGLQHIATAVSTAGTVEEFATVVTAEAQAVLGAAGVTVVLARDAADTSAEVIAASGFIDAYAAREPYVNLEGKTVTAAAIRSAKPAIAETLQELDTWWPLSAAVARELGVGAIACLPIQVGDRPGALSILMKKSTHFEQEQLTFLDLLARTCEQGLVRASLYEGERAARTRFEVLHALSAALSGAVASRDVGTAFLEHALGYAGAGSGALMLADETGENLSAAAIAGSGKTEPRWLSSLPVQEGFVIVEAYMREEPVAATTRSELERRFPGTARALGDTARAGYARPISVAGTTIGAFGLIFEDERTLTRDDERLLAAMAELCGQALERSRLYESEHQIALRLQRALLPEGVVEHPTLQITARYQAGGEAMEVGGDWYDTYGLPDGRVAIVIGDVVGRGIEAAASMGRLRSACAAFVTETTSPGRLLARLDRFAAGPGDTGFATACYAVLDPDTGKLEYASAGHPPALLVRPSGETVWLEEGRSTPLCGAAEGELPEATVVLEPGSLLLFYTDGLVERRGEDIRTGLDRLERTARTHAVEPVDRICDRLLEDLLIAADHPDDVVLVGVRMLPVARERLRRTFPARPDQLKHIRASVREWLDRLGVDRGVQHAVLLPLGEASANAVEHAYAGTAPGKVEVELAAEDGFIVASVRDFGSWRTLELRDPDRGRGTGIINALCSDVQVERGTGGTTVTMTIPAQPAAGAATSA